MALAPDELQRRRDARAAEQQRRIDTSVAERVAQAPPITPGQAALIRRLLLGTD